LPNLQRSLSRPQIIGDLKNRVQLQGVLAHHFDFLISGAAIIAPQRPAALIKAPVFADGPFQVTTVLRVSAARS